MKQLFWVVFLCYSSITLLFAQKEVGFDNNKLSLNDFFTLIYFYHPVVKQAAFLNEAAKQEIRLARGGFDPKLEVHWFQKDLKDKTYYRQWNNFIKIPAWVGDFKLGYELYTGVNVNPENFTPNQGYLYGEFSLSLGKGLIMDERRNQLRQAQLITQINEAEKVKIINKILFQAGKDFYEWSKYYKKMEIYQKSLELAQFRFIATKQGFVVGDYAAIDTIEALLEYKKRQVSLAEAKVEFQNASLLLSNYLWNELNQPVELAEGIIPNFEIPKPQLPNPAFLDSILFVSTVSHPEIIKLATKIKQLEIEKRFRKQELLPELELDLKPLFVPGEATFTPKYFSDNFKLGFNFYMPLFLRKERAKLELTKIKLTTSHFEMNTVQRDIQLQIQSTINEINNYVNLINIQQDNVQISLTLLDAEKEKFEIGESSLFMINSREKNYLYEQEKLIELQVKYSKSKIQLFWQSGIPMQNLFTE